MPKSSRLVDGAKIYYRPIEAAIRWSGLLRFERSILATLGRRCPLCQYDLRHLPLTI